MAKKPTSTDPYSVAGMNARRAAQTPEQRAAVRSALPGLASLADGMKSAGDTMNALNPFVRRQPAKQAPSSTTRPATRPTRR